MLLGELPCTTLTKQDWSGKRLSTSEAIMSEGVRVHQRGTCQTRRAEMMSELRCQSYPCEVSVSPNRYRDLGVWLSLPVLAF